MFSVGSPLDGRDSRTLAAGVLSMLRNISVQAQAAWNAQHASDGSHGDVTATSLVLSGLLKANGRLNIGAPVHLRRPLEADTQPFYLAADGRGAAAALATFIRIQTSSSDPSPLLWHGLDAAGRDEGDVVFFLNSGNDVVEFIVESASAPVDTRFAGNSTAVSGHIELHSGALGIAVYAHNNFLGAKFWHLLVLM